MSGRAAIRSVVVIASMILAITTPVTSAVSGGGTPVQGYAAETPLDNGTIVQMSSGQSNRVRIATQAEVQNMFGVTVDRNILPVTLTNESLENEVFVAVSGTYNVLVSTQGGAIAAGDYLTLSSIDGVAMKVGYDQTTVFGRATASFDGKGLTLGTAPLKDVDGNVDRTVTLGSIPVSIDIRSNPNDKTTKANLPPMLERIGQAIAEREVSPVRIYLSMVVTAVSIIAAIAILYSGVRSGVISIGRNPMSKKSIFRALIQVILTCLLILIIGLFAVYLLLRL